MNVPRYWARCQGEGILPGGARVPLVVYGASDRSQDSAVRAGQKKLRAVADRILLGWNALNAYGYADAPLREEIVSQIEGPTRGVIGIVTRNSYGCEVLNTAGVMFVDIDLPKQGLGNVLGRLVGGLLGRKTADPEAEVLARLDEWMRNRRHWGMRVYRTRAGFRCLVTHDIFDPAGRDTANALAALGADPLFMRLCRTQQSFRARLTPKPWRCEVARPPLRYPWDSATEESRFRRWQTEYESASAAFAVCSLIRELGSTRHHPDARTVMTLHDARTGVGSDRALA